MIIIMIIIIIIIIIRRRRIEKKSKTKTFNNIWKAKTRKKQKKDYTINA